MPTHNSSIHSLQSGQSDNAENGSIRNKTKSNRSRALSYPLHKHQNTERNVIKPQITNTIRSSEKRQERLGKFMEYKYPPRRLPEPPGLRQLIVPKDFIPRVAFLYNPMNILPSRPIIESPPVCLIDIDTIVSFPKPYPRRWAEGLEILTNTHENEGLGWFNFLDVLEIAAKEKCSISTAPALTTLLKEYKGYTMTVICGWNIRQEEDIDSSQRLLNILRQFGYNIDKVLLWENGDVNKLDLYLWALGETQNMAPKASIRLIHTNNVDIPPDDIDFNELVTRFNPIPPAEICYPLPDIVEESIATKLIQNYPDPIKYRFSAKPSYVGVWLTHSSHKALLERYPIPEDWTPMAHHMTICVGSLESQNKKYNLLQSVTEGAIVTLNTEALGTSNEAMAVQVAGYISLNSRPHVTLGVAPGCKPVSSNQISDWRPIEKHQKLTLYGKVTSSKLFWIKSGIKSRSPSTTKDDLKNISIDLSGNVSMSNSDLHDSTLTYASSNSMDSFYGESFSNQSILQQ